VLFSLEDTDPYPAVAGDGLTPMNNFNVRHRRQRGGCGAVEGAHEGEQIFVRLDDGIVLYSVRSKVWRK
jgi:hypothetical protein